MADLMKNGSGTYSALAETYGDFKVPAVRVKIGGTQYSSVTAKETKKGKMLLIEKVDTYLCHDEGSSVSVVVGNAYDLEGSKFRETVSLGDTMQVEVGYGSVFHEIFSGFVGEIQFEYYGTDQQIRITGFDAIYLMSQNFSSNYYTEKKYSDIVNAIIGNYSNVLKKGTIDSSNEQPRAFMSCQGMSDYRYICDVLCPLAGKEFYIFDGKAYFQAIDKREKSQSVSLKLGQSLFDFSITSAYANFEIQVSNAVGTDPTTVLLGKSSGKSDSTQKSAVSSAQKRFLHMRYSEDSNDVKAAAEYILKKSIAERQTARGVCVGLPEIIPGRCIVINGIQKSYESKKFWIDTVHHKINKTGFVTKFTVKGWS